MERAAVVVATAGTLRNTTMGGGGTTKGGLVVVVVVVVGENQSSPPTTRGHSFNLSMGEEGDDNGIVVVTLGCATLGSGCCMTAAEGVLLSSVNVDVGNVGDVVVCTSAIQAA